MKYLFIIAFAFVFNLPAFCQRSVKEKEFINQVIADHNITYQDAVSNAGESMLRDVLKRSKSFFVYKFKEDSVIYVDSMGTKTRMLRSIAQPIILSEMSKGRFTRSRLMPIVDDSLMLSDSEIAYTLEQFEKTNNSKWSKALIEGAKQITKDTINSVFKDPRIDGWAYMYKKGINKFYSFSTPVFIRNDIYCIFYSDNSCGDLCGSGKLAIYKNENGKWTYWGTISSWIS
ncbi:hypothetical protein ACFQZS_13715 [Mucilaginibacter calamicampi]|uniref:Uncharacterized protein n=1 Tax=Mucilaginibacter calamicampi TaxID=1302352 RepID=A0ABW2Z149_9SPHI